MYIDIQDRTDWFIRVISACSCFISVNVLFVLIVVASRGPDDDEDLEVQSKVKKMKPHVPGIVTFADHNRPLPWTVTYHAVVMFADISGRF